MNKKSISLKIGIYILFIGLAASFGEPYMAIRSGLKCVVCHVNASGGGKRTDFGVEYSHYKLNMGAIRPDVRPVFFGGRYNEAISTGANLRVDNTKTREYKYIDSTGAEVIKKGNNLTAMVEGDVYAQFDVIQDKLIFYSDIELKGGGGTREFWGMWRMPWNSYFKYGQMLLPYGLRLYDDQAFVRKVTGYTYDTRGLGGEIGIEPGPFSMIINLIDTRLSTVTTLVFRKWRIGANFARLTKGHGTDFTGNDFNYGGFAGFNLGRFTVFGEADVVNKVNEPLSITIGKEIMTQDVVVLLENDFLIVDGLNFKTTYEIYDRQSKLLGNKYGTGIKTNGQDRTTVGLEAFVSPFLGLGLFYRMNTFIPGNAENQDQVIARIYGFF